MKKSFVYLIVALMLSTMLCGCGMDDDKGVIGASPRPTDAIDIIPSMIPDVSSSMTPEVYTSAEPTDKAKSPQVGESNSPKSSPAAGESNNNK